MRKRWSKIGLCLALVLAIAGLVFFGRTRSQAHRSACNANEKNLAVALELYWLDGHSYPQRLAQLVPHYLKSLPTCPAAGRDSYSGSYQAQFAQDNFQLWCQGHHHT